MVDQHTLDENFKNDMDSASSIERRITAMKQVYEAGIRTVCFVSPVFPGITDFEAIFERVKNQCGSVLARKSQSSRRFQKDNYGLYRRKIS